MSRSYSILYGSLKAILLDAPDTISVVVWERRPPNKMILFSPGRLQQRCPSLSWLSVRDGRGETSVPLILKQDLNAAVEESPPPQIRPEHAVCWYQPSSRSWMGQELPLEGLYSSTFLINLFGVLPPDMMNPRILRPVSDNSEHEESQKHFQNGGRNYLKERSLIEN